MSEKFDPYHRWLGIPSKEQPPHHYRLLGLELYEADPAVIENAADQRMGHVRTYQAGKYSAQSQKILNEISTAKISLLSGEKKAAYDQQLREILTPAPAPLPPPTSPSLEPPPQTSPPTATPIAAKTQVATPARGTLTIKPNRPTRSLGVVARKKRKQQLPMLFTVGAIGVVALLAMIGAVMMTGGDEPVAKDKTNTPITPTDKPPKQPAKVDTKIVPPKKSGYDPVTKTDTEKTDAGEAQPMPTVDKPERIGTLGAVEIAETLAKGESIDLIALADMNDNRMRGDIKREDGKLAMSASFNYLAFPLKLPEEYELVANVTRSGRDESLNVTITIGGHACNFVIDGFHKDGYWSGLELVDDQELSEINPSAREGKLLTMGQASRIVCQVSGNHVVVNVDGKMVADWRGDPASLSVPSLFRVLNQPDLALASQTSYEVDLFELRPLVEMSTTDPPATNKLAAVPDEETLIAAKFRFDESYKDKFADALTSENQAALAKELVDKAEATLDVVERYILLTSARDLTVAAQRSDLALRIIDQTAERFEIDAWQWKADVFGELARSVESPESRRALYDTVMDAGEKATIADAYGAAEALFMTASITAQRMRENELSQTARSRSVKAGELKAYWTTVQQSQIVLADRPDDPEANTLVGEFMCLAKGQWSDGLPLLAKSTVAEVKDLAQREMATPATADDQIAAGDAWWELAKKATGIKKTGMIDRACHWYRQALPSLSAGPVKSRIETVLEKNDPTFQRPAE